MNSIVHIEKGQIEYRAVGQASAVLVLNGGHTNSNTPFGHEQFSWFRDTSLSFPHDRAMETPPLQ